MTFIVSSAVLRACLTAVNSRKAFLFSSSCSERGSLISLSQDWKLKTVGLCRGLHCWILKDPNGWNTIIYLRFEFFFLNLNPIWWSLENKITILWLQKCKNSTGVSVVVGEPKAIAASNFANAKRSRDAQNQNFPGQKSFFTLKWLNDSELITSCWNCGIARRYKTINEKKKLRNSKCLVLLDLTTAACFI